jgi:precorrin-4 methylase
MTVYFIGAGPGDPELITVKGQRLIRSCPVIIYAGSLVPAAVLQDIVPSKWSTAPNCIWNRLST